MEALEEKKLMPREGTAEVSARIQRYLGQYRAEYLRDKIFDLFSEPAYWDRLSDAKPCLIVGGRGTGKTTTLRQLAYEGQYRLHGSNIADWSALGLYWRIETNLTATFQGSRLSEADWIRTFSHYINLQFVDMLVSFVMWRQSTMGEATSLNARELRRTCLSLGMEETADFAVFADRIDEHILRFESAINGLSEPLSELHLSVLGRPITSMVAAILDDESVGHAAITFCLDEYENLEPYQQRVINTLVKHVGDGGYTFKIGMRQNGLHERATLSSSEFLVEPADFVRINIEDEIKQNGFGRFAASVCNDRLLKMSLEDRAFSALRGLTVQDLLPEMSIASEASLLGAGRIREDTRAQLQRDGVPADDLDYFDAMDELEACFVSFWAESQGSSLLSVLMEARMKPREWKTRVGNHGYAMLFSLRPGRTGLSKYYCGWSTFLMLADGNIRYLLYLVTEALVQHVKHGGDLLSPVSADDQTKAAQAVGERVVFELAGLHKRGTQLTRLVLGLGRVFGVMAKQPHGHAPEVSQFRIADNKSNEDVAELLAAGVMHNALVRFTGDKMRAVSSETKDFDYQLHPIVSPFFVYSPRRKRRMNLYSEDFLGLASTESTKYIRKLLSRTNREIEKDPPAQLSLFSEFYNGG